MIDGLAVLGVECLPFEGTYYILANIESLVGYIQDKYFYRLDKPSVKEIFRDRAIARKLAKKYKIGLLPVSALYESAKKEDRFVRIAVNRDYEHLKFVLNAFNKLATKS